MLLPEELNLPRLLGPLRSWVGCKLRRLRESTLLTEAELSCENAATSFSPYCEDHRRDDRVELHSGECRTGKLKPDVSGWQRTL